MSETTEKIIEVSDYLRNYSPKSYSEVAKSLNLHWVTAKEYVLLLVALGLFAKNEKGQYKPNAIRLTIIQNMNLSQLNAKIEEYKKGQ